MNPKGLSYFTAQGRLVQSNNELVEERLGSAWLDGHRVFEHVGVIGVFFIVPVVFLGTLHYTSTCFSHIDRGELSALLQVDVVLPLLLAVAADTPALVHHIGT